MTGNTEKKKGLKSRVPTHKYGFLRLNDSKMNRSDIPKGPDYIFHLVENSEYRENLEAGYQQAQGPKTPRPITVHFKKRPSSSVLEVGMWYLL